jgi:hypothetical protein
MCSLVQPRSFNCSYSSEKMEFNHRSKDLADVSKNYRKRSIAAAINQSKLINKEVQRFRDAVIFIGSCKPAGNCTDDELLSLAIARHKDMMKGSGLDYTKKDTLRSEWVAHLAYKVLTKSPKWQGVDGPVMDLENVSLGISGVATSRIELQVADDDESYTGPPGRKKAKRARKDADAVSSAKSMALSAESVGRNTEAQTERNGIMLFVG